MKKIENPFDKCKYCGEEAAIQHSKNRDWWCPRCGKYWRD